MTPLWFAAADFCFASHPSDRGDLGGTGGGVGVDLGEELGLTPKALGLVPATLPASAAGLVLAMCVIDPVVCVCRFSAAACGVDVAGGS